MQLQRGSSKNVVIEFVVHVCETVVGSMQSQPHVQSVGALGYGLFFVCCAQFMEEFFSNGCVVNP